MTFTRKSLLPLFSILLALPMQSQVIPPLPSIAPVSAGFSPEGLDRMHRSLKATVDSGKHAGYVVLIARNGRVVDWRASGYRDVDAKLPMEKDSIVRIYSMSKLITSVAALMLVEEGRLGLQDPVERYLPAFKNRKVLTGGTVDMPTLVDARQPMTIRQLLTHTSGLYYDFSVDEMAKKLQARASIWQAKNLDDFVQRVATLPLQDQPGERFRYGLSTDILGAVIEKVSGQSLEAFFQKRILEPLKMRDTSFTLSLDKLPRLARIHSLDAAGKLVVQPDEKLGFPSGGGGLYSTAGDYARFAQMLLNGGELEGTRILGRKTVELMIQNHLSGLAQPWTNFNEARGFGLGVAVLNDLGKSQVLGSRGQFGWEGMASTIVQIDPQERVVAILLFQHLPFDEGNVFALFSNGYYSALRD